MTRLVVVGGSDAGISAALSAGEACPGAEVSVLLADAFPNYSICGLPFLHSGEVAHWRDLAHRTEADLTGSGMRLFPEHAVTAVLAGEKVVVARGPEGERRFPYDRLVLATGARSERPKSIAGLDAPGVFFLRFMGDGLALETYLRERAPKRAVIIGAGYIGLEMADALTRRGLAVTLAGRAGTLLKTVDPAFGARLGTALAGHGLRLATGVSVNAIAPGARGLVVTGADGFRAEADLVLVAAGARPETALAAAAGIALGPSGAIAVDRAMATSLPDVFAAGDCVETWHRLLDRPVYLPLGTTAHKQGHVAGANAVGGRQRYAGTLGTQVVKIFDLAVARTGLLQAEAEAAGFDALTVETECLDHKGYYPGAHPCSIRVTGDRDSGRLLGAQILGHFQSQVAKRVDVFATALFHGMRVEELLQLDLSYTPPLGSPWDPVQVSAKDWSRQRNMNKGASH